jgi:hypothetical protein
MKTIPTFLTGINLLTGAKARAAWANQSVRCPCGSYGDVSESLSGTCQDMPAEWLGCDNPTHAGQALGRPLVFRTAGQIRAKEKELAEANSPVTVAHNHRVLMRDRTGVSICGRGNNRQLSPAPCGNVEGEKL